MAAAALEYLGPLQAGVQLVKDAQSIYREWKAAPELIRFLNAIERTVPLGKMIHFILDDYATYETPNFGHDLPATREHHSRA